MFRQLCSLVMPLLLATPLQLQAQSGSVWEPAKKAVNRTKDRTSRATSEYRNWKTHLQQWGLDSSYNRSFSIGGRLNNDGWSGLITYGRKNALGKLNLWQLSFSEVKHEKETKLQGSNGGFNELGSGAPYIYGKQNNLYLLQLTYSREKKILPTVLDGNVSVALSYGGGLTLAMLKPYYLQLINQTHSPNPATASTLEERYEIANGDRFLNPSLILGRGRWNEGMDEIQYVPGLHSECAVVIRPAKGKTFTQAIRLGVQGTVYARTLPVLIKSDPSRHRICLFAAFELGKKWTQ